MIAARCPRFAACASSGVGPTSSTAIADSRVSVRCSHGSPDCGLFRRFRLAEDKSAGDNLQVTTSHETTRDFPHFGTKTSGLRGSISCCVPNAGISATKKTPYHPAIGAAVPRLGAIAELHQRNLSQFASNQRRKCMQICKGHRDLSGSTAKNDITVCTPNLDTGKNWLFCQPQVVRLDCPGQVTGRLPCRCYCRCLSLSFLWLFPLVLSSVPSLSSVIQLDGQVDISRSRLKQEPAAKTAANLCKTNLPSTIYSRNVPVFPS